jgi:RsiW-degrading membrane proteinase PrsW (M82 family)
MITAGNIAVSLCPVFLFLATLIWLDSYKLIRLRNVVLTIAGGSVAAIAAFLCNSIVLDHVTMGFTTFARYISPVIEESFKILFLIALFRAKRIGFMVDAAIYGFAIGAGFGFIENIYYLRSLDDPNLLLWVIRGLGTAMMHGGTTAIYGIVTKYFTDRHAISPALMYLPGLLFAVVIHSLYNHFFLPPIISALGMMIVLPLLLMAIFKKSEQLTRAWLGVGLDADMELMERITAGRFSDSNIGKYLQTLTSRFPPEVIVDMLCLIRLQTELSMRAKGVLMMREAGFREEPGEEIREKFSEMKFLEKSIGATGKIAIAPILHTTSRDLWQLYLAKE